MSKLLTVLLISMLFAWPSAAQTDQLSEELSAFEPYLGVWEIEDEWSWGATVRAIGEYKPVLNGQAVEMRTWVSDNGGPLYERYRALLRHEDGRFVAHTLGHDGSLTQAEYELEDGAITTEWEMQGTAIHESMSLEDDGAMRWLVEMTNAQNGEKSIAMDGRWERRSAHELERLLKGWTPLERHPLLEPYTRMLGAWQAIDEQFDQRVDYILGPGANSMVMRMYRAQIENAANEIDAMAYWTVSEADGSFQTVRIFTVSEADRLIQTVRIAPDLEIVELSGTYERLEDGSRVVISLDDAVHPIEARAITGLDGGGLMVTIHEEREKGAASWRLLGETSYRRIPAFESEELVVHPIDPSLFVASGTDLRSFTKTRRINASASDIFAAWTTSDGWGRLFPEPSKAEMDLKIGGRYHWLFDGKVGSNGCQILSYIPDRMVSFSWNAPPTQPVTRELRTWVVVEIDPIEGEAACDVTLTHLGFGEGAEWDETYAYFDKAWESVLAHMAGQFGGE